MDVDLRKLPPNTCPICQQPALAMEGEVWQCTFCGSELEFDPQTRRARLRYVSRIYAPIGRAIGTDWLTRREMFRRAAQLDVPPPSLPPLFMPLTILAAVAVLTLVIFAAVAAALLLQPSIERTRRAIGAAYARAASTEFAPTPAESLLLAGTASAAVFEEAPTPTPDLPLAPSALGDATDVAQPTPDQGNGIAPLAPALPPLPSPTPLPTATSPEVVAFPPPPTLPPTFTPLPATPLVQITLPPEIISPLPTPTTPLLATPTPTPSPVPTPTPAPRIRIINVKPQGDPAINEADEYVELENVSASAVLMDRWSLRVFQTSAGDDPVAQFTFPQAFIMAPGQRCRVYTNLTVGIEDCGLSNGFRSPRGILPPSGARIVLSDAQGVEQFTYVY
ncbi:MAG: lamin tail domain-containing protein [Anaerolineae bacterium]|nr:lamin tail domain-containing protein [Anaerolineae bacterium]